MKTPAEQCCSPVDWEETDDFLFIIRAVALFICNVENIRSIIWRDLSHTRYVLRPFISGCTCKFQVNVWIAGKFVKKNR